MARPKVEDGSVSIATSLFQALYKTEFTSLELRVIAIVMDMTYAVQKKSAEIGIQDIRYMMGAINKNRTDRITKTVDDLIAKKVLFKQRIDDERFILGIQKDFDKWNVDLSKSDKMSHQEDIYIYKNNKPLRRDKMSPSQVIVSYAATKLGLKLSVKMWSLEQGIARELYQLTLRRTKDSTEAYYHLKDYIDYMAADKWISQNVRFPMSYMKKYYERWLLKQPKKTIPVKRDEQITGYRFRYDVVKERWVRSADKLVRQDDNKSRPSA